MSTSQQPASSPSGPLAVPATVVECDERLLVVLLDDGTRRRVEDPSSLGLGAARRGQRIQLLVEGSRITAAGLAPTRLRIHRGQ